MRAGAAFTEAGSVLRGDRVAGRVWSTTGYEATSNALPVLIRNNTVPCLTNGDGTIFGIQLITVLSFFECVVAMLARPFEFKRVVTPVCGGLACAPSDIGRRPFAIALALVLALSAVLQFALFHAGLYSVSADESARTLVAHNLSWHGVLTPGFWPPLAMILMGLPLKIYNDLFLTPRIEIGVFGILCLCAVAFTTLRLFQNRLAALIAVTLAAVVPQRLILSVVPLSDLYGYLFVITAFGFCAGWLSTNRRGDLLFASFFVMLASATRLEDWFLNAVFGLYVAYRALVRRDIPLAVFLPSAALIGGFPAFWLIDSYLHDPELHNLTIVSSQFTGIYGHDYVLALKNNVLYRFARDLAVTPALLLGALYVLWLALHDVRTRVLAVLFYLPIVVEGLYMAATFSVPVGEAQRSDGLAVMLLVPFAGFAAVEIATRLSKARAWRLASAVALTYALATPLAMRTGVQINMFRGLGVMMTDNDVAAGRYLAQVLGANPQSVLLDSTDNLDYLNILVTSNAPDRFMLNVDAEPVVTGIYATSYAHLPRNSETAKVRQTYLTDKFWSGNGPDFAKMRARGIGFIVTPNARYVAALDHASRDVKNLATFENWHVYALLPKRLDIAVGERRAGT